LSKIPFVGILQRASVSTFAGTVEDDVGRKARDTTKRVGKLILKIGLEHCGSSCQIRATT
jgi:hypothetical protein